MDNIALCYIILKFVFFFFFFLIFEKDIHEFAAEVPKTNDNFPPFPCRKVDFIDRCVAQSNGLLAYAHNKFHSNTNNKK